jgi:hypothetical protein
MRRLPTGVVVLPVLALLASGCSDAGPSNLTQLSFNLATKVSAPAASTGAAFAMVSTPETFTDGTNTLVINKVELVLREIELRRTGAAECADGVSDDCEELEIGPVLVDVPLGTPGAARSFSVQIAPGSYDKVEFEIHKPSSSDDAGFIQANPAFNGTSVLVTGTYNGAAFEYASDLNGKMEFDLNPALVANETAASDLTLFLDLDKWFRDSTGGLVDPATANQGGANEVLVEQNIQSALDAFEDDDHDGRDDGPNHH